MAKEKSKRLRVLMGNDGTKFVGFLCDCACIKDRVYVCDIRQGRARGIGR